MFTVEITVTFMVQFLFVWSVEDGVHKLLVQEAVDPILHFAGYKSPTIAKLLWEEGMQASRQGIDKFIRQYRQTGTIARKLGSGHPSKVTAEMKTLVEEQMHLDDETTTVQLHQFSDVAPH